MLSLWGILAFFVILWPLPYITASIFFFLSFLFLFLQVLFFTTCERKILALTQRRLGPHVVGTRGRLQFLADALKLVAKNAISPKNIHLLIFQSSAIGAFWISWFSFCNLNMGPGEDIIDIEFNIFFLICTALIFSIAWLSAGIASKSKYSILGATRAAVQIIAYEILTSAIFLILFLLTGSTNFEIIQLLQESIPILCIAPFMALIFFFATLLETNRPPFDLSEAESDVVAGYTTEFGGILFGLFYLGEYINLFTNALIVVILFSGGWFHILHFFDYLSYIVICFQIVFIWLIF